MGTRSLIGKQLKDGSILGVYCHYDGYPEFNGRILRDNFDTCLLYTSPSPRDKRQSRMPSSA